MMKRNSLLVSVLRLLISVPVWGSDLEESFDDDLFGGAALAEVLVLDDEPLVADRPEERGDIVPDVSGPHANPAQDRGPQALPMFWGV